MMVNWNDRALAALVALFLSLATLNAAQSDGDIDGDWSGWSAFETICDEPCGGGKMVQGRSCTNPKPRGNGLLCLKTNSTERANFEERITDCNTHSCYEGVWEDWEPCRECENHKVNRYGWCGDHRCNGTEFRYQTKDCMGWNLDCPGPCITLDVNNTLCPEFGKCKDTSTEEGPDFECVCTMDYVLSTDGKVCIRPLPPPPTPRPIPTLPPEQKVVATVISKTASTVLIIFVTITLIIFAVMRIFTPDRVIQMNMEIALLCAHICLVLPAEIISDRMTCRILSIIIHFFFMATYAFIMLEALHMYSLVAFVVKKDGMFSKLQNTIIGWSLAAMIIFMCITFNFEDYGAEYHCWLQFDTSLAYGNIVPIIIFSFLTVTLIEAAGSAEYKPMKGIDGKQLFSAKISQRTNLVILPFVIAHWFVGALSEYQQNLPLYGTFSVLNGILGFLVFFFHTTNNTQVREKLKRCFKGNNRV